MAHLLVTVNTVLLMLFVADCGFIIDDDWMLELPFPFPTDVCLQTSPSIPSFSEGQWNLYECNDDGTLVTKKKWDVDKNDFDCSEKIDFSTTIFNNSVDDLCDVGYFVCEGYDKYVSLNIFAALNEDCDPANSFASLKANIVTDECFCSDVNDYLAAKFTCDATTAVVLFYPTDEECKSGKNEEALDISQHGTCTLMGNTSVNVSGISLAINVYTNLLECNHGSNEVDVSTSISPNNIAETSSTLDDKLSHSTVINILMYVGIGCGTLILLCIIGFVLYQYQRKMKTRRHTTNIDPTNENNNDLNMVPVIGMVNKPRRGSTLLFYHADPQSSGITTTQKGSSFDTIDNVTNTDKGDQQTFQPGQQNDNDSTDDQADNVVITKGQTNDSDSDIYESD